MIQYIKWLVIFFSLTAWNLFYPALNLALPDSNNPFEKENLWKFAHYLEKEKEYYRAVTEYERFILYYPEDVRGQLANQGILRSYFFGEAYQEGARKAENLANSWKEWQIKGLYYAGIFHYFAREYDKALNLFSAGEKKIAVDHRINFSANLPFYYRLLWVYLEKKEFASAEALLERFHKELAKANPLLPKSKEILYISHIQTLEKETLFLENMASPSPLAGALLSALIPGLGQTKNDRWQDGLFSFLSTGILAGLTYAAFKREEKSLGFALGTITFVFYSANIYGGYVSALRQSHINYQNALTDLKKKEFLPPEFISQEYNKD
jgi:tetratricopeptide (TPR) repeat protein